MPGYHNHKGGNQWFVVNEDQSISPTHAPYMVFGIKNDELVLVKKEDSHHRLIFDQISPSYDLETLKTLALKPSSHKGKGVVLKKETRQHGHGMEQMLEFGPEH